MLLFHSTVKPVQTEYWTAFRSNFVIFSIKLTCKNQTIIQTSVIGNSLDRVIEGQRVCSAQKASIYRCHKPMSNKQKMVSIVGVL